MFHMPERSLYSSRGDRPLSSTPRKRSRSRRSSHMRAYATPRRTYVWRRCPPRPRGLARAGLAQFETENDHAKSMPKLCPCPVCAGGKETTCAQQTEHPALRFRLPKTTGEWATTPRRPAVFVTESHLPPFGTMCPSNWTRRLHSWRATGTGSPDDTKGHV